MLDAQDLKSALPEPLLHLAQIVKLRLHLQDRIVTLWVPEWRQSKIVQYVIRIESSHSLKNNGKLSCVSIDPCQQKEIWQMPSSCITMSHSWKRHSTFKRSAFDSGWPGPAPGAPSNGVAIVVCSLLMSQKAKTSPFRSSELASQNYQSRASLKSPSALSSGAWC